MAEGIKIDELFWVLGIRDKKLDRDLRGSKRKISGFSKFVERRGKLALTALGVAAAGVGIAATRAALSTQKGFARVSTLVDTTTVDMEKLRKETLQLFQDIPVENLDDLIDGLFQLISSGAVPASDAMEVLTVAAQASVAGFTSVTTSVNALTTVMNAFGASGKTAAELMSQLFVANKLGKTTIDELGKSMGNVAGVAFGLGIELESILAPLIVLTKQGNPTAKALTAIRSVLAKVLKPTKELAKAFPTLSTEFNLAALQAEGFVPFLLRLIPVLKGNQKATNALFEDIEALSAVLGLAADGGKDLREAYIELKTDTGALGREFAKVADQDFAVFQKALNTMKVSLLEIGDVLLPPVAAGLERVAFALGLFTPQKLPKERASQLQSLLDSLDELETKRRALPAVIALLEELGRAPAIIGGGFTPLLDSLDQIIDAKRVGLIRDLQFALEGLTVTTADPLGGDDFNTRILGLRTNLTELADEELRLLREGLIVLRDRETQDLRRRAELTDQIGLIRELLEVERLVAFERAKPPPPAEVEAPEEGDGVTTLDPEVVKALREAEEQIRNLELAALEAAAQASQDVVRIELAAFNTLVEEVNAAIAEILATPELSDADAARAEGAGTAVLAAFIAGLVGEEGAIADAFKDLLETLPEDLRAEVERQLDETFDNLSIDITVAPLVDVSLEDARRITSDIGLKFDEILKTLPKQRKGIDDNTKALKKTNKQLAEAVTESLALARTIDGAVSGALDLAGAFGLVGDEIRQVLEKVSQVATGIEPLTKSLEAFKAGAVGIESVIATALPVAGGIASLISILGGVLFGGPSPEDIARRKAIIANSIRLRELTDTIGNLGLLGDVPGARILEVQAALQPFVDAAASDDINAASRASAEFTRRALAMGLTIDELNRIATEMDITFANRVSPTFEELVALAKALAAAEITQFAETIAGQLRLLQLEFDLLDVTDPIEQLKRLQDVINRTGEGFDFGIFEALGDLDFDTEAGREAAEELIRNILQGLAEGTITREDLGDLTTDELLALLRQLEGTLDQIGDGLEDGQELQKTQNLSAVASITESTAGILVDLGITRNLTLRTIRDLLERQLEQPAPEPPPVELFPRGPIPVLAPPPIPESLVPAAVEAGPGILIEQLTVVVGDGADAAEAGAQAADGLLEELGRRADVELGRRFDVQRRNLGDTRRLQ